MSESPAPAVSLVLFLSCLKNKMITPPPLPPPPVTAGTLTVLSPLCYQTGFLAFSECEHTVFSLPVGSFFKRTDTRQLGWNSSACISCNTKSHLRRMLMCILCVCITMYTCICALCEAGKPSAHSSAQL